MTTKQHDLWTKILAFELDDPSHALTFTDRLARENNWSLEYALRATHEYKKFLFMLSVADHPLTPSDQVDQVWHLHLLYTESYWKELCENTLGRPIHHGPTKGGENERQKYDDLYGKTLALYQSLFETEPPADIWPNSQIRFSDIHFCRVNMGTNWVIKKPKAFIR